MAGLKSNAFYNHWRRIIPAGKTLLALAGANWEAFQQTEAETGAAVYTIIRAAQRENRELAVLYRKYKQQRQHLRRFYAYSVPSSVAIQYLTHQKMDLLEIGCGKAYWAYLLRREGVDVVASDVIPPHQNRWVLGSRGFLPDITIGGSVKSLLEAYKGRAVLLQWIPRGPEGEYALDVLQHYRADHLFVVGEGVGGATACDAWFQLLDTGWDCIKRLPLPRFVAVTDSLYHYVRRHGCA